MEMREPPFVFPPNDGQFAICRKKDAAFEIIVDLIGWHQIRWYMWWLATDLSLEDDLSLWSTDDRVDNCDGEILKYGEMFLIDSPPDKEASNVFVSAPAQFGGALMIGVTRALARKMYSESSTFPNATNELSSSVISLLPTITVKLIV